MRKRDDTTAFTAEELEAMRARGEDRTDWSKVDTISEEGLEQAIAEDPDEAGIDWDWTKAELVMPRAKQSVHLRLDADIISFFKKQGPGHITRMQAVLRAYVDAHKHDRRI